MASCCSCPESRVDGEMAFKQFENTGRVTELGLMDILKESAAKGLERVPGISNDAIHIKNQNGTGHFTLFLRRVFSISTISENAMAK